MRSAEWRLFLPNDENRRHPAQVRNLVAMLEDVAPVVRTDFYVKADADVGVKRRGGGTLECKTLKQRQVLGGGVGPGEAETFEKVKLGNGTTSSQIIEHLRGQGGGISELLEATLKNPVEVRVMKFVRKKSIETAQEAASFEVTEATVTFAEMPEDYPKKWLTFCVEGPLEAIESFLGSSGKPLVALMSLRGALQIGYPQFIEMIAS